MALVRLNDLRASVATSWAELKTRHYIKIIKEWQTDIDIAERDYLQLLNILSDGQFAKIEAGIELQDTLLNLVGWVVLTNPNFSKVPPKVFEYKKKIITIPEDIADLPIGQNIHLRRDYIDKSKCLEENIAIAAAIYLQPLIDEGPFNIKRAQEICKDFEEMPVGRIFPLGFFLLRRVMTLGDRLGKHSNQTRTSLRQRLKRTLLEWLRSDGLIRSTTFR